MTLPSLSSNLMFFLCANVGPTLASQIQPVSSTISIFGTLRNPNSDSMFIVPSTISEVTDTINNLQNCNA